MGIQQEITKELSVHESEAFWFFVCQLKPEMQEKIFAMSYEEYKAFYEAGGIKPEDYKPKLPSEKEVFDNFFKS